ncbi:DNA topoisomerase [Burkholderia anthina]|uniref:DNA topoisomerase n=1 Tax=Burkholderia anthina TaxID=179879 RepID=UPI00158B841F
MKNLVIVEASGKVDSLRRELKGIGLFADVVATVGHIADNPKSLVPIELDENLRERSYAYREDRAALLEKIRRLAAGADRIFIATDDDQEGDVIAWDLSKLLDSHAERLFRVRLRAITEAELSAAFSGQLSQQFEPYARNGVCRRVIDRAIGATFTLVAGKDTVPVGRVQSSLLASIAADPPAAGRYTVAVTTGDGARFTAGLPVHSAAELAAFERVHAALAAGQGRIVAHDEAMEPLSAPWGYEQVVIEASERLKVSVGQAADLFQEAYEKGRVSYPRVRTGVFTRDAVEVAAALARHNRCSFDWTRLPVRDETGSAASAHEAPRVYDGEMMLGRSLNVLDPADAVAVLVARNIIESAQVMKVRRLTVEVEGIELTLRHWQETARRNWKRPEPEAGYHAWSRELAILRYMGEKGLGRPSTVIGHAMRLIQRGLLEETGIAVSLSSRGERWLARAREVGFTAEISQEMERALERPMRDPHARAAEILDAHGMLEPVRKFVTAAAPAMAAPEDANMEPV